MSSSRRVLTFVTGNANKLREVREILAAAGNFPFEVESKDLDLPEIQGDIEEVAIAKCKAAARALDGPCITEDTALCFSALKGLPGVYVKDFMKKIGHEGLNNLLATYDDKSAEAVCTFAYCASAAAEPIVFQGRTRGIIVPARGPTFFGWDPVFQPEESNEQTYAEMDKEEKNKISHRYRALEKLQKHLVSSA
ncbi:nucleoside triphosphate pyrophosphohydrolase ham1 [Tilletia horrida]|nr:nucleoside triphosphate pyrophosphohydrolase ham1 [Tilletia horrida]